MAIVWSCPAWPGTPKADGSSPCQARPRQFRLSSARSFARASASGVPLIDIIAAGLRVRDGKRPARAELKTWLGQVVDALPIWEDLIRATSDPGTALPPVGLAEFGDRVLPEAFVQSALSADSPSSARESFVEEICESLFHRAGLLADLGAPEELELLLRPTPFSYLHLGAVIHMLRLSPDGAPQWASARLGRDGAVDFFVKPTAAVKTIASRLNLAWRCSFEAVLVARNDRVELADLFLSDRTEVENSRRLASEVAAGPSYRAHLAALIANTGRQVHVDRAPAGAPIMTAHAFGMRCGSGPLATSMAQARAFATAGRPPVIVVSSLLPGEASMLEEAAGLVLARDGPASHIAVLARSMGVAVLTQAPQIRFLDDESIIIDGRSLAQGEIVSVDESDGALYRGEVLPASSSADVSANYLETFGRNGICLTIGATSATSLFPGRTRRVGLCRSEMQIFGSPHLALFQEYLSSVQTTAPVSVPEPVRDYLRNALQVLLVAAHGEILNYRLIDASLHEAAAGAAPPNPRAGTHRPTGEQTGDTPDLHRSFRDAGASIRGPRWALRCGLYKWQLAMVAATAAAASRSRAVNLVVTLPSAFTLEEVEAVRDLFDEALDAEPDARRVVRFGVMIETPRLCATPTALADLADVFCFGLNDLTQAMYGLGRDSWSTLEGFYKAAGLSQTDPFQSLDALAVGPLVAATIDRLRAAKPQATIILCGGPAADEQAIRAFSDREGLLFSVSDAEWTRATLSYARTRADRDDDGLGLARRPQAEATARALERVAAARSINRSDIAQGIALRWFGANCPLSLRSNTQNWKVLKKQLVGSIFGEPQGRYFHEPWQHAKVSAYARDLLKTGQAIRVSAFPNSISCHARSELIKESWTTEELTSFLREFDPATTLNVFPQQSADQMCFRLVCRADRVLVEAGWGQAMYVFEAERGQHSTLVATGVSSGQIKMTASDGVSEMLSTSLAAFLNKHGDWIRSLSVWLPVWFGAEQIAVEGYFDPERKRPPVVVDIDLPLDLAWN